MNRLMLGLKAINGVIEFNNLKKYQRQITFYSEGRNYWPHFKYILMTTLDETKKLLCYISSSLDDPGLLFKHPRLKTFFVGDGFARDYFFKNLDTKFMIMTMPDLENFQVKRSNRSVHYIYIQHSLVSLHMIYREGAFNHFDTICAAGPHHIREIRAIERIYRLPKKNIVKHGYSRLDSLIKIKKKNNKLSLSDNATKKILIAPSWGPVGMIESGLCKKIIQELLLLEYEVILRPHPQTIKFSKSKINDIINVYENEKNFKFEKDLTCEESLYRSNIMISDWSGVAIEYAFALNKPVIFCDLPKKVNNQNYLDIKLKPLEVSIREKIGIIWDCNSPLSELLFICCRKNKKNFSTLSKKHVFNVGRSDKALVEFLKS